MKWERSCGAVVFTRENGQIKYLLVQNLSGVYGFPKGHMEAGESERETAAREIMEEVGLRVSFLEGFRAEDTYPSPAIKGWMKKVTYFLAEFSQQEYHLQEAEIKGGGLYTFAEAAKLFRFAGSKRILMEANRFLTAK